VFTVSGDDAFTCVRVLTLGDASGPRGSSRVSSLRQEFDDAIACGRCDDPHEWSLRVEPTIKVEHEPVRGQEKREVSPQGIVRVIADVECDCEIAHDRPFETDTEE
jgi:hypothetical protein